jgi:hypothetical protein
MPRARILAKAVANYFPVVCPSGQPAAVQNRSQRFCRGELTADWCAQNPDLISGENSAAALLERIKVERALTLKPKRKTKT